jgi:hypothetical protein
MTTEKVKSKKVSWKDAIIIPVGVLIILCAFKISVTTGFALEIGLCLGSLGQKLGWWNDKNSNH